MTERDPGPALDLEFTTDPAHFLAVAGDHLAADPLVANVVCSVTERAVDEDRRRTTPVDRPRWWVTFRDGSGAVVGAAMRTAPFAPYPLFVLPLPAGGGPALARALHERGEPVGGVNGALPAVREVAEETARLAGGSVSVHEHTRLFELGTLRQPAPVPGRLRRAAAADVDLVLAWFHAFGRDAAEQSGRHEETSPTDGMDRDDIAERVADERVWLWEDERGEVVHLTGCSPPSLGVARIGPVYTPAPQRGRGWASAGVAAVSRMLLARDARVCLFTDQANPTSNRIYQALGYRRVVDMADLVIG